MGDIFNQNEYNFFDNKLEFIRKYKRNCYGPILIELKWTKNQHNTLLDLKYDVHELKENQLFCKKVLQSSKQYINQK